MMLIDVCHLDLISLNKLSIVLKMIICINAHSSRLTAILVVYEV